MAIGIVVLSIVITAINPNFFTVGNLFDLLRFITVDGLLALGVLIVLISGGVDVSFPAIANFSTYIVVTLLDRRRLSGFHRRCLPAGAAARAAAGAGQRLLCVLLPPADADRDARHVQPLLRRHALLFWQRQPVQPAGRHDRVFEGRIDLRHLARRRHDGPASVDPAAGRGSRAGLAAAALHVDRPRHLRNRRQPRCGRAHRLPHSSASS